MAELQHVSAFWVGLLHELLKIGLIQQQEGQDPEYCPRMRLTVAGVEELAGLTPGGGRNPGANAQPSVPAVADRAGLRTTRMRCSRALVQSLLQPCGGSSETPAHFAAQVLPGLLPCAACRRHGQWPCTMWGDAIGLSGL